MPLRLPAGAVVRTRAFSSTTRPRSSFLNDVHTYPPTPVKNSQPKLGMVGKGYLPTMAVLAVGMSCLPDDYFSPSEAAVQKLDNANRKIGYAITTGLSEYNSKKGELHKAEALRQAALMEAYGDRSNLADLEKAIKLHEVQ